MFPDLRRSTNSSASLVPGITDYRYAAALINEDERFICPSRILELEHLEPSHHAMDDIRLD